MGLEIKNDCLVNGIDPEEFITFLGYKSGGSSGKKDKEGNYVVTYTIPLLRSNKIDIIYGKKHQIKSILFSDKKEVIKPFIDETHKILTKKSDIGIHNSILYSNGRPLFGYYFNKEYNFQILAIPETSPKPEALLDDHPFIIQFPYYKSGILQVDSQRRSKASKKWELFCIGLLDDLITTPTQNKRWVWGIENKESWTKLGQDGYIVEDDYETNDSGFFIPANDQLLNMIEPSLYYKSERTMGDIFMLPNNFEYLLKWFTNLDKDKEDQFLRSSYWLLQSSLTVSSSLSYTALAFSLETLLPQSKKVSRCPTCKTENENIKVYDSISNQIKYLINDYTNLHEDIINKLFKKFYGLRSKIAHGDHIFSSDTNHVLGMDSRYLDELTNYQSLRYILKIILYNWFISDK